MDHDFALLLSAIKLEDVPENGTSSGESSSHNFIVGSGVNSLAPGVARSSTSVDNSCGRERRPIIGLPAEVCSLPDENQFVDDYEMVDWQPRKGKNSSGEDEFLIASTVCDLQRDTKPDIKCENIDIDMPASLQMSSSTTDAGNDGCSAEFGKRGKCEKQTIVDNEHDENCETADRLPSKAIEKEKTLSCLYCEKILSCRSSLKRHEKTHTGDRPYVCPLCGKSFIQCCDLNKHVRRHNGEKPYPCLECDKQYSSANELTRHKTTHSEEKPHPCSHCGKRFGSISDLNKHVPRHLREKPFVCIKCGNHFAWKSELVRHIRSHSGEKRYECQYCHKRFTRNGNMRKHASRHEVEKPQLPDDETPLGKVGNPTRALEKTPLESDTSLLLGGKEKPNESATTPNSTETQLCTGDDHSNATDYIEPISARSAAGELAECTEMVAETLEPLVAKYSDAEDVCMSEAVAEPCDHTSTCSCTDSVAYPYFDENCPSTRGSAEMQKSIQTDTVSDRYSVELGKHGKPAIQEEEEEEQEHGYYNRHSQLKAAEKDKLYACQFCEKRFAQQSLLKIHEKAHACPSCDKSFDQSSKLKEHVRTHAAAKPFICSECGTHFTTIRALTSHMKRHNGETPYVCMYCEKRFVYYCRAKKHMQKHQRPTRFACTQCGDSFAVRTELIRHRFLHVGERAHECQHCHKRFLQLRSLKHHTASHKEEHPQQPFSELVHMHEPSPTTIEYIDNRNPSHTRPMESETDKLRQSVLEPVEETSDELDATSKEPMQCVDYSRSEEPVTTVMADSQLFLQPRRPSAGAYSDADAVCLSETAAVPDDPTSSRCADSSSPNSYYPASSQLPQQHSLTHDVKAAYECEKCRARFTDYGQLLWHMVHGHENHGRQLTALKQEPMD